MKQVVKISVQKECEYKNQGSSYLVWKVFAMKVYTRGFNDVGELFCILSKIVHAWVHVICCCFFHVLTSLKSGWSCNC